jgi:hypothetical protein
MRAFLDDDEFEIRIGIDRETVQAILAAANLNYESSDPAVELTINNCMNEVAPRAEITPIEWRRWFFVSLQEVRRTFLKWKALRQPNSPSA